MLRRLFLALIAAAGLAAAGGLSAQAAEKSILLQSTTSTKNSGLFEYLLPKFTEKTGIAVNVVAVGTGQALKNAENGDGDVVLSHAKSAEEKFVADGFGVKRVEVMFNDFIIVGPKADPARIAGGKDAVEAMRKIAAAGAPFASRGDDSGTHKAELKLWKDAGVDPKAASGQWYRETGSGMGATLNAAAGMGAYTLTDRATFASFANRQDMATLVEGDRRLYNQYAAILVSPAKHSHVKAAEGQAFIDWLVSPEGQTAIAGFRVDGEQVFFPNAAPVN
jgi:tungstate transport system substrate-binding protein